MSKINTTGLSRCKNGQPADSPRASKIAVRQQRNNTVIERIRNWWLRRRCKFVGFDTDDEEGWALVGYQRRDGIVVIVEEVQVQRVRDKYGLPIWVMR